MAAVQEPPAPANWIVAIGASLMAAAHCRHGWRVVEQQPGSPTAERQPGHDVHLRVGERRAEDLADWAVLGHGRGCGQRGRSFRLAGRDGANGTFQSAGPLARRHASRRGRGPPTPCRGRSAGARDIHQASLALLARRLNPSNTRKALTSKTAEEEPYCSATAGQFDGSYRLGATAVKLYSITNLGYGPLAGGVFP